MTEDTRYRGNVAQAFGRIAGEGIKYASLMAGVYSVCKDEADIATATVAGLGYLLGETISMSLKDINASKRASLLEQKLNSKAYN